MKKRLIAALLTLSTAAMVLTGCGSSKDSGSSQTTAAAAEDAGAADAGTADTSKEVELVMYVVSDRPAGQDVVDENLNKLLKEKLNCTLKINWIGWAEYAQKYPMLYSSGESFDMAYCAGWLNFSNLAR